MDLFSDMTQVWVDRFGRFGQDFLDLARANGKWGKDQSTKLERLEANAQQMIEWANALVAEVSSVRRKLSKSACKQDDEIDDDQDGYDKLASYDEPEFDKSRRRVFATPV